MAINRLAVALTKTPITYVADTAPNHIDNLEYLKAVSGSPPTVLHLGMDVPFTHSWGPIQALGGGNQSHGNDDSNRRLSADEVEARIEGLRKMVQGLHRAGVKFVLPYICSMTLAGHHKHRTGFWEFYDHWEEYERFGLGPRPRTDPIEWMQLMPSGSLHRFYKYQGAFYPPFGPKHHRYAACVNNPDFRYWLTKVAELVARSGYDGAFVDNSGSQMCYCKFCREKFREFIKARYTVEETREYFGTQDLSKMGLATSGLPGQDGGLLWVETQRFWKRSLYEHQAAIKAAGKKVRGSFLILSNGGGRRPENVKLVFPDTDYVMFELPTGDYGTNPGMAEVPIVEDISTRKYNDNVFAHKYTQCLRQKVKPMVLTGPITRAGWPKKEAWLDMNPAVAELGMAECGAFSGGGGFLIRERHWGLSAQALNTYREFFETHSQLYQGMDSWAQVGVAMFAEQNFYRKDSSLASVKRLTQELLAEHILFDYITEEAFTPTRLERYEAVILPQTKFMSKEQVETFLKFVSGGNVGIIIGDAASATKNMEPYEAAEISRVKSSKINKEIEAAVQKQGSGHLIYAWRLPVEGKVKTWLAAAGKDLSIITKPAQGPIKAVKINAFISPYEPRILLHMLNYNVPLGVEAKGVQAVRDISFKIPLPQGWIVKTVKVYGPHQKNSEELRFETALTNQEVFLKFALGELKIYRVIEIVGKK